MGSDRYFVANFIYGDQTMIDWRSVPNGTHRSRLDCFADLEPGRYTIKKSGRRDCHYTVRLNDKVIGQFEYLREAKKFVAQDAKDVLTRNGIVGKA